MVKPKYYQIIKNITRDDVTDIDKGTAIMQMLEFTTLNHVSKDELVEIIRYLFPFVYDWDGKECVPDTNVGEWKKYPEEKPEKEQEIQFYWVVDGEILRGYGVLEWHAWDCGDFVLRTTHTGESQSFLVEDTDVIYWYERPVPPKNQKEEHSNDK